MKSYKEKVEIIKTRLRRIIYNSKEWDNEDICIAMRELMDELGQGPETEFEAVMEVIEAPRRRRLVTILTNIVRKWRNK